MTPEPSAERRNAGGTRPRLSVVVPVHNSSATLGDCVRAAVAAAGPEDEIILADDGSSDRGIERLDPDLLARVSVVGSAVNIGRGPIRNLGAATATGAVLVFLDSDVALERSALERVGVAFSDPDRVAVIGSYDDRPADTGVVSQYRNLLHHHTHHTHGTSASHFWTGIGAVRKDVFEQLGGLDTDRWARDMEDVEFGHRLVDAGHTIDVMPDICGTHYKRFTLRSMIRVDLRNRAIPWSHLMIANRFRTDEFVTSPSQVLSALFVALLLVALAVTPFAPIAGWVALAAFLAFVGVNASLWRMLARSGGVVFALRCIPLHLVHTTISGLGFVFAVGQRLWHVALGRRLARRRRRRAAARRAEDEGRQA